MEWFDTSLKLKSMWLVMKGSSMWNNVIRTKYLKCESIDNWLRRKWYFVQGTSYFQNGFIWYLSWITSEMGWKAGNGKRIRLGTDSISGKISSYLLSEELQEYLNDYGINTLNHA